MTPAIGLGFPVEPNLLALAGPLRLIQQRIQSLPDLSDSRISLFASCRDLPPKLLRLLLRRLADPMEFSSEILGPSLSRVALPLSTFYAPAPSFNRGE